MELPPHGLFDQIHDLLQWGRETWGIDPLEGWDSDTQRFRGLDDDTDTASA